MNIFLTGGTGFIGQPLAAAMRRRGWSVHALVRNPSSAEAERLAANGCTLVPGDVTDPDGLADAMAGADVLVHNAGVYEIGGGKASRERMQAVNVQGTENVLAAAQQAGVAKTIYVSSVVALDPADHPAAEDRIDSRPLRDGRHATPYNQSKAAAHRVALEYRAKGLPIVNVMPNAVVGANDHSVFGYFQRLHLAGRNLPVSMGKHSQISPVHVDSLVEGFCLAIEKGEPGDDFVFSGEAQTLHQIFGHLARQTGGMKVRLWLPGWFLRPQMLLFEWVLRSMKLPAFMSRELVDQTNGDYAFSSAKAERDLGWTRPSAAAMWDQIFAEEKALVGERKGLRERLRPVPVEPEQ